MKYKTRWFLAMLALLVVGIFSFKQLDTNPQFTVGQVIDEFNNVSVYYNGGVNNVVERHTTDDGYNLGLKYQCVEFVKRYYYEHLNHKMPDSYGHAKDFFNQKLKDGEMNTQRNLVQYHNAGKTKPKVDDLIVFDGHPFNRYGHVAIISYVDDSRIEIIQQNAGQFSNTRASYSLTFDKARWTIKHQRLLGWLRKE